MKKQELEELQRLEEALMATEFTEEDFPDELDLLDDTWQELTDIPYDIYNTDDTAVDLDALSQEVLQPAQKSSAAPVVLIVLLSCIVVFCAMKILGVV